MVGIIAIGLIGGVIAATVFAVIPWAQDNAAKQQLDSIHTAQNAFYGLSSDPTSTLTGGITNSFTDSTGLETANLLTQSSTYCVIPTDAGKDYIAYVKSASGKVYSAANKAKTPTVTTSSATCLSPTPTPTPTPTTETLPPASSTSPVLVKNYPFNSQEPDFISSGSSSVGPIVNAPSTNGMPAGENFGTSLRAEFYYHSSQPAGNLSASIPDLIVGKSYRITSYLQHQDGSGVRIRANELASPLVGVRNYWTQAVVEFTATSTTNRVYIETGVMSSASTIFYIESLKIERIS
jgi:hypothetical protein